ncbi:hypothetical protein N7535_001199 [Penicillium sp. DV-2018c]|nr:hypothetical protein N7461_005560 [Penicillium sp. DV-2018c]KAJ5582579.1 hypothetical protein N7535_001199 [Penicillium sp. DV-2018c]
MRFSIATVLTGLTALATAYTTPDYSKDPSGNAIVSPGLNEIVPEGKTYTIKWEPTTQGPVSLVLLRGPSTNVKPLKTLAESIPNSGSFKWTPGTDLEADTTHYGLLLVVEGTGQYQYSTQFGISAPAGGSHTIETTETTTICPETETTAAPTAPAASTTTVEVTESTTYCPESDSTTAPTSTPLAPAPVPQTTITKSREITTTICPETETSVPTPAPHTSVGPVSPISPVGPTSRPWSSIRLTTSAATGTATAAPSASSPVYNSAGRNAISFGAVMAGVLAAFAL